MQPKTIECRLCGGIGEFRFSRRATDGDEVSSYECTSCRSLQTEDPYWLGEVYSHNASKQEAPSLDTWAVERTGFCRIVVFFIWKLGGISNTGDKLLDWGGGPGLLVRMLRDVGIDAYNYDKYVRNHFASGFSRSEGSRYNFVTAFEVLEHFPNPKSDLEPIFALQPSCLLISTCLYKDQGPNWGYLGPAKSQHVFFYSDEAFRLIGRRYGYRVVRFPQEMTLFVRQPIAKTRLAFINMLLAKPHLAEIVFALKRKWSLSTMDHLQIRELIDRSIGDGRN